MKGIILLVIILSLLDHCNSREKKEVEIIEIAGTTWECKIADVCINRYEFKDDHTFLFFSCEMDDVYSGDYYLKEGDLMILEKGYASDSNLTSNTTEWKLYKLEIKENTFKHVLKYDWVNGKWELSSFKFDQSYLYHKRKDV
jgi:hypothetical protein